jgi:serine phosphatase RsbU (regulator of sigma subunit)
VELNVLLDWAVHVRSYPGAPRGGDAGIVIPCADGALAVLVDGAGHGLSAYSIAQKARRVIFENEDAEPGPLLERLDDALKNTPGAAISVARLRNAELHFAGVGNVQGSVGLRPLTVRAGVVGLRMHRPIVVQTELKPDVWFLMHTDGVSRPTDIPPGAAGHVARALVERFGSSSDDAAVLALRWREALGD